MRNELRIKEKRGIMGRYGCDFLGAGAYLGVEHRVRLVEDAPESPHRLQSGARRACVGSCRTPGVVYAEGA